MKTLRGLPRRRRHRHRRRLEQRHRYREESEVVGRWTRACNGF